SELLAEARADAGRPELAEHALTVESLALEDEQILHGDELAFVAPDLTDLRDLAGTVLHPLDVHDKVDGRDHLLADRAQRQVRARHEDHGLDPRERVAGTVRVDRRQRSI